MKKITTIAIALFGVITIQAQNNCQNALNVAPGTHPVTFLNNSQVPLPSCITNNNNNPDKGAWFKYTPTVNHTVTISTVASGTDTRVHIYNGTCGSLACVAADDDSGPNNTSVLSFGAMANITYYIAFDNNWNGANFNFSLTEAPFVAQPFVPQMISPEGAYTMCVVDMNGDYLDDIVSVNDNSVHVLYQNANGSGFTAASLPAVNSQFMPGWSMAAGDFDKNGFNDLLYGAGDGASIMLANATGTGFPTKHSSTAYLFSQRSNFVDINNDGNLDAFVCHDVEPNVYFLNDGNGGADYIQGGLGDYPSGGNYGSIWVDYDNDGDSDLFIAKCRGGGNDPAAIDELHQNNGDGTFVTVSSSQIDIANMADMQQSWSSAWADYDNDGDMDAFVGASSDVSGGHRLKMNNLNGTFTDVTVNSGFDTFVYLNIENVAHDFDNDGFVDVFGGGNRIMHNNGDMTFTPILVPMTNGPIGDLNNDGFLDVQNGNQIFFNSGNENNWIKIQLEGVESNGNGIGARVELYGAWGKQIRDVRSGDGFKYMSSLNTHFGIGEAEEIEKVVVKWPSGTVDTIDNPAINSRMTITEGSTLAGIKDFASAAFTVSPNPAKDVLNINSTTVQFENATIYDLTGKMIKTSTVNDNAVNVQSLAKGMYLLVLKDLKGNQSSVKFIKG